MLSMTSLASGSSGNATLIHTQNDAILIDCGLSFKKLTEKLKAINYDPNNIRGIFITHEHSDHISGLRVSANKLKVPTYINHETSLALKHKKHSPEHIKIFTNGSVIQLEDFFVTPFSIPHDGANTVAYTVNYKDKKIAVATDFGFVTQSVLKMLEDCDALLLESNHDVEQLIQCEKRPWSLKQRILSKHGHLSNEACQEILTHIISPKLKNLILGHLSNDANDKSLVEQLTTETLKKLNRQDICVQVMPQGIISKTIIV